MSRSLTASAPGKMVLLGEYAVLYGAPALVAAVDRRARARFTSGGTALRVSAAQLRIEGVPVARSGALRLDELEAPVRDRLRVVAAVLDARVARGLSLPDGELEIDTAAFFDGPRKLGLGSSAAVAVASWAVLAAAAGDAQSTPLEVLQWVLDAHRAAQGGAGSGVDVAASLFGGVLSYTMGSSPTPAPLPAGIELLPVWTGRSASTPQLVARVDRSVRETVEGRRLMDAMAATARAGAEAALAGDAAMLLRCAAAYGESLAALGDAAGVELVTAEHATLARLARAHGVAYKPSGAGGGDLGILFCYSREASAHLARVIQDEGFSIVDLFCDDVGVEVSE